MLHGRVCDCMLAAYHHVSLASSHCCGIGFDPRFISSLVSVHAALAAVARRDTLWEALVHSDPWRPSIAANLPPVQIDYLSGGIPSSLPTSSDDFADAFDGVGSLRAYIFSPSARQAKRDRAPPLPSSGIGSPAHSARLVQSFDRVGAATANKPMKQFISASLGDVSNCLPEIGDTLVKPHEVSFIPSTHRLSPSVRDENGEHVQWPWETSSQPAVQQPPTLRPVRSWHRLDDSVNTALNQASRDGKRGRTHSGVKAWFAFCQRIMGTQADRPLDPNEPLWAKLEEEWLAMRYICALVEDRGIAVESARVYFASVQGWHAREHGVKLAGGLKLERLPQMLKGLRRIHGEVARPLRRGISPLMLKKAMDFLLDPNDPADANVRAALATALQGLLRSAEYSGENNAAGKKLMLLRDDLVQLTDKQMVVMMHPCKNMHHLGGKTCPLVIGAGGTHLDAVWEVANMLKVDPTPVGAGMSTPLFRVPSTNKPLGYAFLQDLTKRLMVSIGEDPSFFGTHSYRIGGATALFAAGANETVIRTMGRWSSDLHRLYVRACFDQCCEWTRLAGSATVSEVSGTFDEVDYY